MKLVMTLLVRDEQDIVKQNIEYHIAQGVDHFIITNNLSRDSTPDIIGKYRDDGLATIINENDDTYDQQAWVTRMARLACDEKIKADWIIHSDADEFWIPATGTLKHYFSTLPEAINITSVPRHDFVCIRGDDRAWHEKMLYRKNLSLSIAGHPIPPVVAHRSNVSVKINQGNHSLCGMPNPIQTDEGLEVLHFPIRSQKQYENKIRLGGAAYHRNTTLPKQLGMRWRNQYTELIRDGSLNDYFYENSADDTQISTLLKAGDVITDTRINDYLKK